MANTIWLSFSDFLFFQNAAVLENVWNISLGPGIFSPWIVSLSLLCNSVRAVTDIPFALQELFAEALTISLECFFPPGGVSVVWLSSGMGQSINFCAL